MEEQLIDIKREKLSTEDLLDSTKYEGVQELEQFKKLYANTKRQLDKAIMVSLNSLFSKKDSQYKKG